MARRDWSGAAALSAGRIPCAQLAALRASPPSPAPDGPAGSWCRYKSKRGKGRWTREEHESFLKGVELHGKDWKAIGDHVRSRTVVQIRTHAQKYFLKADKGIAFPEEVGAATSPPTSPASFTIRRPALVSS